MKDKLTPEQSQRLIELGVDVSKASGSTEVPCGNMICHEKIFTLSDVLSLLLKEINNEDIKHQLYKHNSLLLKSFVRHELIDGLYELLCWTLTRNKNETLHN